MEPESKKISVFTYKCIRSTKYKAVNIFEKTSRIGIKKIQIVRKFQGKKFRILENFRKKHSHFFSQNPKEKK